MANGDIRINLMTAGQTRGNSFASVTVKKNLWPVILANLNLAKGSRVHVGWPGSAPKSTEQHDPLTGMSNVQVAVANEVGSAPGVRPVVPARPVMKATMLQHGTKYRETITKLFQMIVEGKMSTAIALGRIGRGVQGDVMENMAMPANGTWKPANAPSTIARKGSSTPLIDSGHLRQSVTWKVVMKGSEG